MDGFDDIESLDDDEEDEEVSEEDEEEIGKNLALMFVSLNISRCRR